MPVSHPIQLSILRELLYKTRTNFASLNTTDIPNDHFTFHLKRLVQLGIVEKTDKEYQLTSKGLEVAGRINLQELEIVQQPKVGIALCILDEVNNKVLVGERLHEPLKGKVGFYTEKVKLGESLFDTCKRCLLIETGLTGKFSQIGVVRIIRQHQGEIVTDVLFNYFKVTDLEGELQAETGVSRNLWIDFENLYKHPKLIKGLESELDLVRDSKPFFIEKSLEGLT